MRRLPNPEAQVLLDKYLAGKMGTMEFASFTEGVRIKLLTKPVDYSWLARFH